MNLHAIYLLLSIVNLTSVVMGYEVTGDNVSLEWPVACVVTVVGVWSLCELNSNNSNKSNNI